MFILSVGPKIPYPPTDGGRIGIFQPLAHLAGRGLPDLVTAGVSGGQISVLLNRCGDRE